MTMRIDGGCHCGKIKFEAEVDPRRVTICHCTDCQSFSGAPYRASVPVNAENLTLHGQPRIYEKTAANGNKRLQAFCQDCGSPIYATGATDRTVLNLRLGAINQRAELPPTAQGWCGSALPCAFDISGIRRIS
jgi:hypothetical protein